MNVVRLLAANADISILNDGGIADSPLVQAVQYKMLTGDFDHHPAIQGLINGLVVLLGEGHGPTQEYFSRCKEIPEGEYFLQRMWNDSQKDVGASQSSAEPHGAHELPLGPGMRAYAFSSFEELMEFLARQGR